MQKYITRTLFVMAMLALMLNNGIDIWRKLRPIKVESPDPVVALPEVRIPVVEEPVQDLAELNNAPDIVPVERAAFVAEFNEDESMPEPMPSVKPDPVADIPPAMVQEMAQAIPVVAPAVSEVVPVVQAAAVNDGHIPGDQPIVMAEPVVYSEAWLKADRAEKARDAAKAISINLPDPNRKLPYRVMWPNGKKSQLVAREFYEDGSHTDWFLPNGRGRHYRADGTFESHIKGSCVGCGSTLQTSSTVRSNPRFMVNGTYPICPNGKCSK